MDFDMDRFLIPGVLWETKVVVVKSHIHTVGICSMTTLPPTTTMDNASLELEIDLFC
jgi:hypothetical protein